jgi:hypothetical protein
MSKSKLAVVQKTDYENEFEMLLRHTAEHMNARRLRKEPRLSTVSHAATVGNREPSRCNS